MEFIRQNLSAVIAAAAVLVVGAALVMVNLVWAEDVEVALQERVKISSTLKGADRRQPLNDRIVAAEKRRVENIQRALSDVVGKSSIWNRENFQVLEIIVRAGDTPGVVKAFPVDRAIYEEYKGEVTYKLTREYRNRLKALLGPLKPVAAPTSAEVEAKIPQLLRDLRREKKYQDLGETGETALVEEARRRARRAVQQEKTRGKLIYASLDSLDVVFPRADSDAKLASLWKAQVNLWVTRDVLEAIRLTNEQVVASRPGGMVNIANSAIKELLNFRVLGHARGAAEAGRGGRRRAAPQAATTVTGRFCSKQHDVVRYQLTVVMPLRYIERFGRNLMSMNYHTILNSATVEVRHDPANPTDYGREPVMQVTFVGELLLLTSWERDMMPVEVLRTLPPEARRDVDNQRLQ